MSMNLRIVLMIFIHNGISWALQMENKYERKSTVTLLQESTSLTKIVYECFLSSYVGGQDG